MERVTKKDIFGNWCVLNERKEQINAPNRDTQQVFNYLAELEDKIESGAVIELPLSKQDVVFHIVKRMRVNTRTKPEHFYSKRMVSWKGFISIILDKGDDGLWFSTGKEAEARLKELQEK